jgi:DNA replication protein DnaC
MFDRDRRLLHSVRESKEVRPGAQETPEAAYKAWLAGVREPQRFCAIHKDTKLRYYRKESGVWPAYDYPSITPTPGEFDFTAVFVCPTCCMVYALCPPEFHGTNFETFEASTLERAATLAKAREFAAQVNSSDCGFGLLVGPPGQGKTRLACNVIRELIDHDALYVRQGQLTLALRASYGSKHVFVHRRQRDDDEDEEKQEPTPLEITQNVNFLVLDELGCTALANDERLLLDELIKYRYEQRKPTILISNLPLKGTNDHPGIKEFLGDALTDRIKEASGNGKFIVQFSGESYRRTTSESYLDGLS